MYYYDDATWVKLVTRDGKIWWAAKPAQAKINPLTDDPRNARLMYAHLTCKAQRHKIDMLAEQQNHHIRRAGYENRTVDMNDYPLAGAKAVYVSATEYNQLLAEYMQLLTFPLIRV